MTAQGLHGNPVYLLDEFLCYRFKLFQDGGGFFKLCAGRELLQHRLAAGRHGPVVQPIQRKTEVVARLPQLRHDQVERLRRRRRRVLASQLGDDVVQGGHPDWIYSPRGRAGATTASSVSANTDMLVCGANVGASKTAKAEKLRVQIVEQDVIWRLLIAAGVA